MSTANRTHRGIHCQSRQSLASPMFLQTAIRLDARLLLRRRMRTHHRRAIVHPLHPRRVLVARDDDNDDVTLMPYAGLSSPKASWCRLAFSLRSAMLLFLERAAAAANDAAKLSGCGWWPADGAVGGGGGGGGRQKRPPAAA